MSDGNTQEEIESGWTEIDLDALEDVDDLKDIVMDNILDVDDDDGTYEEPVDEADEESVKSKKTKKESDGVEDSEDDTKGEESEEKKTKRKSRAQDRIRQLANEKNALAEKLATSEAENLSLKNSSVDTNKTNLSNQKTLLDNQIKSTNREYQIAIEDQDVDVQVEMQDRMQDLKVDARILEAQISNSPEVEEVNTEDSAAVTIPEEMKFWITDNPWALEPTNRDERKKVRALKRMSNELLKEGYSENDIEFYEEIDAMLEDEFGEEGEDGVQLDEDQEGTPSSSKTLNTAKKKKAKRSPVSGPSRTPISKKGTVRLTREEKHSAKKLDVKEERYALRKKARDEAHASGSGWTVIG